MAAFARGPAGGFQLSQPGLSSIHAATEFTLSPWVSTFWGHQSMFFWWQVTEAEEDRQGTRAHERHLLVSYPTSYSVDLSKSN